MFPHWYLLPIQTLRILAQLQSVKITTHVSFQNYNCPRFLAARFFGNPSGTHSSHRSTPTPTLQVSRNSLAQLTDEAARVVEGFHYLMRTMNSVFIC